MRIGTQATTTNNVEISLFNIASDGPACSKFIVKSRAGGTGFVAVRCPQLGQTTAITGFQLAPGESVTFECGSPGVPGINQVIVWQVGATAVNVDCAVLAQ